MNPIEAAEQALRKWEADKKSTSFQRQPAARAIIVAWVRGAVGCPTCKGTRVWKNDADMVHEKCPEEPDGHVRLTVFREAIYADPAKCEWRCAVTRVTKPANMYPDWNLESFPCKVHHYETDDNECGWQPRMDVLLGGE